MNNPEQVNETMEYARLTMKIMAPLRTPLMSDILAGHLFWAIRREQGAPFLEGLLQSFGQSSGPPFLLSDPFPRGFLPRPALPLFSLEGRDLNTTDRKKLKKLAYVPLELITVGPYSHERVWLELDTLQLKLKKREFKQSDEMHNTIDRSNGLVLRGNLFSRERLFPEKDSLFDLYVAAGAGFSLDMLIHYLEMVGRWGYGADSSTGCGFFEIEPDRTFEQDMMVFKQDRHNAFLLLSHLVTDRPLPDLQCSYQLHTKFGRLYHSESLAVDDIPADNIFKMPLVRMKPGAVFQDDHPLSQINLLRGAANSEKVCEFGLPMLMPFALEATEYHHFIGEVSS